MAFDVTVEAAALKAALGSVRAAVAPRGANPVTAFVHLTGENGRLIAVATDGSQAMEASAEAQVEDWGAVLVDHAKLSAVAGLFSGAAVRLTYREKQQRLAVRCGKAEHVLPCGDVADFPPIQWEPDGAPQHAIVAQGESWARGCAVASHVSEDANRYGLNGVSIEKIGDEGLRLVATDGSRLAWSDVDCTLPISGIRLPKRLLLPPGAVRSMARAAASGGTWGLRVGERSAAWAPVGVDGEAIPGVRHWFRLIEGEFPDYRLVMPPGFKRVVKVDAGTLVSAIKGVSLAAEDRNHSVDFTFEESRILLAARSVKGAEARTEVEAEVDGVPMRTGFNGAYLSEALSFLGGGAAVMSLGNALDPCMLTSGPVSDPPSATLRGVVVMPMRLD